MNKYYLKHEQECFVGYKTRGEVNGFKNVLYPSYQFIYE